MSQANGNETKDDKSAKTAEGSAKMHAEKAKSETKAAAEETAKVVVAKAMTNRGKIGFLSGVVLTLIAVGLKARSDNMSSYNQDAR